jgi:hypothetical protein
MRAGRAIRQAAAHAAVPAYRCGHGAHLHRELADVLELVDGRPTWRRHPAHVVGQMPCHAAGCSCRNYHRPS